jgi:hypothetical protein
MACSAAISRSSHLLVVRVMLSLVLFLTGCAPSVRAMNALKRGDRCEFCRISAGAAATEPSSAHNLGLCYENGWCGYDQNKEYAVQQYTIGARWGVQESRNALVRLGVTPPVADLKIQQDLADARERAAMWGAVASALANSANTLNNQPTYNSYQGNQINTFAPALNYQGCCSYHMGINRDMYGNINCHFSGAVLCNDFQPSPTCRCN